MTFIDLSRREADEILAGGILPGRRDLESVLELTTFMRASGEVEPPPPMRADLLGLLGEPPSPS